MAGGKLQRENVGVHQTSQYHQASTGEELHNLVQSDSAGHVHGLENAESPYCNDQGTHSCHSGRLRAKKLRTIDQGSGVSVGENFR